MKYILSQVVISGLFCQGGLLVADINNGSPQNLLIVSESYKANKALFDHGRCHFTYSWFSAESEESALKGARNDVIEPAKAEFNLYFKDNTQVVRMDIDDEQVVEHLTSRDVTMTPYQVAIKGNYALDWDGIVNDVIVHSPDHSLRKIQFHPFNLAEDSSGGTPAAFIDYAHARDFQGFIYSVEETSRNGREYLQVELEGDPVSTRNRYFIDKGQGYLPMITEWYWRDSGGKLSGELYGRMFILETHQEGNAYFPLHAMMIVPQTAPKSGKPFVEVREMKVVDFDPNYEPTDDDLSILLPRTAQFSDGLDSNTAKTLYRGSDSKFVEVGAHQIEDIYDELKEIAEDTVEKEAALAEGREIGSERVGSKLPLLVAVNAILLFLILGAYLIKRQRAKNA